MLTLINEFDEHLSQSDADSQDWADGLGAEKASVMLSSFADSDWSALKAIYKKRGAAWRACLASVLSPQHGEKGRSLLFELAEDEDIEVSFMAIRAISFNCGVNSSAEGPFVDLRVRNPGFLSAAKSSPKLKQLIRKISPQCAPLFQRDFQFLLRVLGEEEDVKSRNDAPSLE